MSLPTLPAVLTDKFCGCVDIDVGLRILSILYAGFWVSTPHGVNMALVIPPHCQKVMQFMTIIGLLPLTPDAFALSQSAHITLLTFRCFSR
jgi:hypothetical protein